MCCCRSHSDFAYTSYYAQSLQYLCGAVLLLSLLTYWKSSSSAEVDAANAPSAYFSVGFCLVNCAFVNVFVRKWELRQRMYASEWGVSDLKDSLQARPQFRGQLERSPINLRLEPHYPPHMRLIKRVFSYLSLLMLSAAMLGGYFLLISSEKFESSFRSSQASLQGSNLLIAVMTKCVGIPLAHVSKRLNDWENYKTRVDYDANLTLKCTFVCSSWEPSTSPPL